MKRKILLTGSTSAQCNPVAHKRSANFAGLLWESLREGDGNEVHWKEPSARWTDEDLRGYDTVIVGLAPPMAMGANRLYGALSVIERLWGTRRLAILLDTPDQALLTRGLRSVHANREQLTKPFFSYRKEYAVAHEPEVNQRLRQAIYLLLAEHWGPTIIPAHPWTDPVAVSMALPAGAAGRVNGLCLDQLLIDRWDRPDYFRRERLWAVEKGADPKWMSSLALGWPATELPSNHRTETDTAAVAVLDRVSGLLAAPGWWSPKVAMALARRTPVFTDWQSSARLGREWAELPGPLEVADPGEPHALATVQLGHYLGAIPGKAEARSNIYQATRRQSGARPRKAS